MSLQLFEEDLGPDLMGTNPESALLASVPAAGIGMEAPKPTKLRDSVRSEFDALSPMRKVGAALSEFGAGITGKASPLATRVEEKRKEKLLQFQELKQITDALEHGVSMRTGMDESNAAQFDAAYGDRLEQIQPGMKQTYMALTKRPDLLSSFKEYAQHLPEPLRVMMKSQPKEFLKFAGTAEGMKVLVEAKDKTDLKGATLKVQTAMLGLDQFVPPEKLKAIKADNVVTASEILDIQQYLPKEAKLSDTQIEAIKRNDRVFWEGLGVLHGPKEQELLADRAKKAGKPLDEPKTQTVEGNVYQWDPENQAVGKRLPTDSRYKLLGPVKAPGSPGGIDPKIVETELKLSDDWRQDTRKFAERKPLFESATDYMANRGATKTSAGDAALAYAYAKARDPNDRLAVSETKDLAKLGNMFERIGVNIVAVLDKGETLPDRVAKEMYDEIRRVFTEQNKAQGKLEKQYEGKIKAYGGDPNRVLGERLSIPDEQLRRGVGPNEGGGKIKVAVGTQITRGGKKWKVVGHDKDGEPLVEEVR